MEREWMEGREGRRGKGEGRERDGERAPPFMDPRCPWSQGYTKLRLKMRCMLTSE